MPRTPDPDRKPELVAQIIDYLADRPLQTMTFRDLAKSLGVSTYTLVYHFGTRTEMLNDIIEAVADRQRTAEEEIAIPDSDIDVYFAGIMAAFEWSLEPANIKLQRLEFEAAIMEAHDPERHHFTRNVYAAWGATGTADLVAMGLSPTDAAIESRILNNIFHGFQYDLVINGNRETTAIAFRTAMERYRTRLSTLIEISV